MERDNIPSLFNRIKEYFHQTRWTIVIIGLITFLTHGSILFSQKFGIDTELMMDGIPGAYLGRPGLVWLDKLLGLEWFNLYYAQILTFLFLALTPIAFGLLFYLMNTKLPRINLALLVFATSFIVSPFLVSHIYFICQSAHILLAYLLIAVALYLVELTVKSPTRRWFFALSAIILMNVIFGCYQVLVISYLTGAAAIFIIASLKDHLNMRQQFRWVGVHASCFLLGFVSYLIISNLFYGGGSDYLSGMIVWNKVSLSDGILGCIRAVKTTLTATPPYYSGEYGLFILLFFGILVCQLISLKKMKKGSKFLIVFAGLFLAFSPYIFIIFLGGNLLDRIQLTMPLSQSCMIYLIVTLFPSRAEQEKVLKKAAVSIVAAVFTLLFLKDASFHLKYCSRFYYTDEWVFQYDTRIAEKIYQDLQEVIVDSSLDDTFDNYLFLGYPNIPYTDTSVVGHTMGYSFFRFGSELMPRTRIGHFMRNVGYPITSFFTEGEEAAYYAYFEEYFGKQVDAMPSYPLPGYIQYLSNDEIGLEYVIIKLGNSWRFDSSQ